MNKMFDIMFVGLKIGEHAFSYKINNQFLAENDVKEVLEGEVEVNLILNKKETMLVLDFDLKGDVVVLCDLCLEKIRTKVSSNYKQIMKFSDDNIIEEEGIISIPSKECKINVEHTLYEMLSFSIPSKRTCRIDVRRDKRCDRFMLNKIETLSKQKHLGKDPRWKDLGKLKFS